MTSATLNWPALGSCPSAIPPKKARLMTAPPFNLLILGDGGCKSSKKQGIEQGEASLSLLKLNTFLLREAVCTYPNPGGAWCLCFANDQEGEKKKEKQRKRGVSVTCTESLASWHPYHASLELGGPLSISTSPPVASDAPDNHALLPPGLMPFHLASNPPLISWCLFNEATRCHAVYPSFSSTCVSNVT